MTWYAFRTRPQTEFVTRDQIEQRGIRAIVPTERRFIRYRRSRSKGAERVYPLIVGYVFVDFEERPPPWYLMFSMHNIHSVVGFGGHPTPIPETAIGALMRMSGESIPHGLSTNTRRAFAPGDDVRIADGPFNGFEGRVEGIVCDRARMVLEMLGAYREVAVPLELLEAA